MVAIFLIYATLSDTDHTTEPPNVNSIAIHLRDYSAKPERPYRIAVAIVISVALHVALIYGYRLTTPAIKTDDVARVESMTVWIRPPKPVKLPVPLPAAQNPALPAGVRKQAPRAIATLPAPATALAVATTAIPDAAAAPDTAAAPVPKFDMEAARTTARKMAGERDPAKVGTAVGQIPDKPLETETQLARRMAQAARPDCKNAPGGLLAPLLMLLDKKDSGCKF